MARDTKTLRIFVGSPGDVADARNQAFEIIERLDKDPMLPDGYAVEAVGWDRTTYASPTWLCPQKAIDKGLPRPSACDIALFILWRRIGTPLREADYPQETHPPGLERPPTGTEWEFFDAMAAAEESGAPLVLTFRCTREQTIATEDNEEEEQLIWQRRQVRDFFKRFRDNKGGHRWSLIEYGSLEELADKLDAQLRATVQALTQSGDSHPIDPLTTPTGRPLQRPPRHPHFTGRAEELQRLLAELRPGKTHTLCGPGGIGKTALAAEAIWELAPDNQAPERFPDGILFHSFYNQPSADLALEGIARAYGVEPKPTPEQGARQALSGKTALLCLDGAEDADDLDKVRGVAGGCGILVTSRRVQDAPDTHRDLQPLSATAALALLRAWGGRQADDQDAAERVCELVGGLPLAVRLVGRYLDQQHEPVAEYLRWLQEKPLEALDPDGARKRHDSVPWLIARSLDRVGNRARSLLGLTGQLALAPFGREIAAAALGLAAGELRPVFRKLTGYGLLQGIDGRYEVTHALIHTYARERLDPAPATRKRLVAWYQTFAREQTAQGLVGYRRLDVERAHLLHLLAACMERQAWRAAQGLAAAIKDYLDIQDHWTDRIETSEAGLAASRQLADREGEGTWLGNLGIACRALGQIEKAIGFHEQALAISQEIGDRRMEGADLGNLGGTYHTLGQVEQAIGFYEQALAIAREIGDRWGEESALGNLGNAYNNLGQIERAIA